MLMPVCSWKRSALSAPGWSSISLRRTSESMTARTLAKAEHPCIGGHICELFRPISPDEGEVLEAHVGGQEARAEPDYENSGRNQHKQACSFGHRHRSLLAIRNGRCMSS